MAELTTTSYAILGLLALRDQTTYELAKQMQRTVGYVWPRAERKLYDEPKRLAEAGYARAAKDMVGRRPRTTYSITPAGREALSRWLGTDVAPPALEFEGMLRVLFADQGTIGQLPITTTTSPPGQAGHSRPSTAGPTPRHPPGPGPPRHAISSPTPPTPRTHS